MQSPVNYKPIDDGQDEEDVEEVLFDEQDDEDLEGALRDLQVGVGLH